MERVDADLVPFAQNNPSGYRFAFGTDTVTDDINANYNDNIKKGWGTTPNEFPEVEDFNAFAYTSGYLTAYLYQMGIAEWNNKQKYKKYSRVIGSDGKIYKAKEGTDLAPNVNNNPTTDTTNWELDTQFDINTFTDKATPIDTDNLAIQEVGGLFKKLSWANLKATLKTYFDTLYNFYNPTPTIMTGIVSFNSVTNEVSGTNIGVGVEIGDVILFSGATDTKNNNTFTIGTINNNNSIIVNPYHANKGTSRNVATRVNDVNVVVKLLAKWYNASDGLGQDWVNVIAGRALNTVYPNITNREIKLLINGTTTAQGGGATLTINGNLPVRINSYYGTGGASGTGEISISRNGTYSLATNLFTVNTWYERV